jgi:hypothetical protein
MIGNLEAMLAAGQDNALLKKSYKVALLLPEITLFL